MNRDPPGREAEALSVQNKAMDDDALCQRPPAVQARVVLEQILPDGAQPHPAKVLDIIMLCVTGGRERMLSEYASLLTAGGFRLDRVVPTASALSAIVGKPA